MAERLLMIEDDAALAQLVREYLGPLGFSVSSVGTAAEGLRRVEADSFDAVLLDVMLPDLDGIIDEVLEASRLEARGPAARREPVDVLALLAGEDG